MIETENLAHLPRGWAWAKLGEICLDPQYGWTTPAVAEGKLHLLRTTDITSGKIDWESVPYCKEEPSDVKKYLLEEGDVVISRAGSVGFSHLIKNPESAIFASYLIRFKPLLDERYLACFLKSPLYWQAISERKIGIAVPNVNASKLKQIPVPVAPLNEQKRIVSRLEELFSVLNAGVESLRKVKAQLKRYCQAVLKYAFEGKLTEEWRETHKDRIEPASVLLKHMLMRRREKWESDQSARMLAKGRMPKDDNWKKRYKEPLGPELTGLPQLPKEWVWVNLGQLTWSVKDGPHYSPEYVKEGIPFITGGNVRPSGVDFVNAKKISKDLHQTFCERCKPEIGDILYTKGGTTGIARVNSYDREFSVWVHVAVLKLAGPIEPFYVQHALNSPFCYEQAQRFTHGVGNQDLGLTRMVRIILSLPPLAEQKEITSRVDYLQSIADEVEDVIEMSLKRAEHLRQTILKNAFMGKLVPQDPIDEPADKLLARIKKDKAKQKIRLNNRNGLKKTGLMRYVE